MGLFKSVFGEKKPTHVKINGKQLHCEICGHDSFWRRDAQLNTAVASFFNFDWANASAICYVCDGCGYIHWFLPNQ